MKGNDMPQYESEDYLPNNDRKEDDFPPIFNWMKDIHISFDWDWMN